MVRAPEAARQGYELLHGLLPRWAAILDAHRRLLGIGRDSAAYTPVRTIDAVYPRRGMNMGKIPPPPWSVEPMARLLWYVTTPGVDLWLPTLAEEREAYEAAQTAKKGLTPVIAPTLGPSPSPQRPVLNLPGARGRIRVRVTGEAPTE